MSIIQGTAKASGDASFYPFEIGQSLRFDGSSYLSRTPSSAGNRQKYTWSSWFKIVTTASDRLFLSAGSSDTERTLVHINSSDLLSFINRTDSGTYDGLATSEKIRDTSSFYHAVFSIDSTQSASSNRVKIYLNGVQLSTTTTVTLGQVLTRINNAQLHTIGRSATGQTTTDYFDGYMAEINFIDGSALTPTSFGETKNGVWIPKNPSGLSYGTNGFRLAFNSSDFNTSGSAVTDPHGSSTNVPDGYVADASGSGNHWNVN